MFSLPLVQNPFTLYNVKLNLIAMDEKQFSKGEYNAIKTPYVYDLSLTNNIKLELVAIKGGGGFSKTYIGRYYDRKTSNLASDADIFTPVIVKEFMFYGKCMRKEDNSVVAVEDLETVERYHKKFKDEAEVLATLKHPNIVKVISQFDANNTSYFVMEQIKGLTLTEMIYNRDPDKRRCFKLSEALRLLEGVFKALSYIHNLPKPILHLDIKPDNILVENYGYGLKPYLIDFGLCKAAQQQEGVIQLSHSIQAGSVGYSPREMTFTKDDYDEYVIINSATDIYSLGATLYFMLTGKNPPNWAKLSETGLRYPLYADPRAIHILQKSMQIHDSRRTQTIEEFVKLCNEALALPDLEGFEQKPAPMPITKNDSRISQGYWQIPLNDNSEPLKIVQDKSGGSVDQDPYGYDTIVMGGKNAGTDKTDSTELPVSEPQTTNDEPVKPINTIDTPNDKSKLYKYLISFIIALSVLGYAIWIGHKDELIDQPDSKPITEEYVVESTDNSYADSTMYETKKTKEMTEQPEMGDTVNEETNRKNILKYNVKRFSNNDELTTLLQDYSNGKLKEKGVKSYFTDDAYFLITDGTTLVGAPGDMNHTISALLSSDYISKGYKVKKIVYKEGSNLISSIRIGL